MSKEKWNDAWKIMKDYPLEFDSKYNNKFICIICEKVLINPHKGPCGCRYCLECVTKYLNKIEKICPGNAVYCKDEQMDINQDIHIDIPMNRKIMEMIVKCPQKNCNFKTELLNIADHVRICNSLSDECPYFNLGCKAFDASNIDVKNHMSMEIVPHSLLLLEHIDNLKNEMKILKEEMIELVKNKDPSSKELPAELKMMNDDIERLKKNLLGHKNAIRDSKLEHENENREMKESLTQIKNALVEEKKSVAELKKEVEAAKAREEFMKKSLNENQKSFRNWKELEKENKEMKGKIKEIENKLTEEQKNAEPGTRIQIVKDKERSLIRDKPQIKDQGNGKPTFEWRIDKWTQKMRENAKTEIKSESFFSHLNGYKMHLSVWPNGRGGHFQNIAGTHMSIACFLMRGNHDDRLPWPFKHSVTFELVNQHTNQIHTSCCLRHDSLYEGGMYGDINYRKDNRKPLENSESNLLCYDNKFVSLKDLLNDRSLIDKDQILIRCRVTSVD